MTSPGESFVIQLARASRKANYIIRKLSRADRDDVIAAAMLWCWQNRDNYSLTTTLDTWFVNAVKDAMKALRRGELQHSATQLQDIPTGDTTLAAAQALEAADKLMAALPPEYKKVAKMQMAGHTWPEMVAQGVTQRTVDEARARIKQLRKLLPDDHEYRKVLRNAGVQPKTGVITGIDREIEALNFAPAHGKECPPCWRCKWFEGYLPGPRKDVRMEIVERSVKAAVLWTERRKQHIAQEVRDGNL
jgi:DNA-directed RNA polymerase specialized sigma24 family protein